jgi:hypothetical protein
MSDDLVERVARAMADERWGDPELWGLLKDEAKAAIAIALEEAARVAEIYQENEITDECGNRIWPSAAIRAMIPSGTIPAPDDTGNAE